MSRKKPNVLLENIDNNSGNATQILYSDTLYIVLYKGKPFNLKLVNKMFDYPGPKYKKTSFTNFAHARNLALRLNTQFGSNDFTVSEFNG